MKIIKVLVTLGLALFSVQSLAGFYIEPGVFYEKGDNSLVWPSPLDSSTGTTKGLGVDLKLGVHFEHILFIAVDGTYSKPKFENSANNYSANATSSTLGGILGLQMPILGLRAWAGYVFTGTLDPEESSGTDVKFSDGKGPKFGVGFHIAMISINVEYMDIKYDTSTLEKAGPVSGTFDQKLENKVGMVSISLPFFL